MENYAYEKNEKTTYVTLFGVETAKGYVETLSKEAIALLQGFEKQNPFLSELLKRLIHRDK